MINFYRALSADEVIVELCQEKGGLLMKYCSHPAIGQVQLIQGANEDMNISTYYCWNQRSNLQLLPNAGRGFAPQCKYDSLAACSRSDPSGYQGKWLIINSIL